MNTLPNFFTVITPSLKKGGWPALHTKISTNWYTESRTIQLLS
jgi:hypothetical protein